MDKYRNVPIISADDDCIYKFNYANQLYKAWLKHKNCFITYWCKKNINAYNTAGYATLHPPYVYGDVVHILDNIDLNDVQEDDLFYLAIREIKNLCHCLCLNKSYDMVAYTHNEQEPLHNKYKGRSKEKFMEQVKQIIMAIKPYII